MWITVLTVFSDNLTVIVLIIDQETLWILVNINVDLSESSVDCCLLISFTSTIFKPRLDNPQLVTRFHLLYKSLSWTACT